MEKFDIEVRRNGNKNCTEVDVVVTLPLYIEKCCIHFSFECSHQYAAALLQKHIEEQLCIALEQIRKNAYKRGYSDHRKKQRKLTEFYRNFNPKDIGW